MHRTRPFRCLTRRRVLWTIAALLVLFLAWQVYDIFTGKPEPKVDYATPYYELSAGAQPEGENAWLLFVDVISRVGAACDQAIADALAANPEPDLENDIDALPDFDPMSWGRYRPERWEVQLGILDALEEEGTFASLTRLSQMPRCVAPLRDPGSFSQTFQDGPPFRAMLKVCGVQRARMRIAAHEGRWDDFVLRLDESLSISRFLAFQSSIMHTMIAEAGASNILDEVIESAIESDPPESACRAMASVIEARLPLPPLTLNIKGQRLIALDELQHIYTASGRLPVSGWGQYRGTDWGPEIGSVEGRVGEALAIIIPGHAQAREIMSRSYDEAIAFLKEGGEDQLVREFVTSLSIESVPIHQVVHRNQGLMPLARLIHNFAVSEYRTGAVMLMLAIEAYRARHGAPPESLAMLVPDFIAEVPTDRLSSKPFGYRLLADDPDGRTYLLYSLGADGEDQSADPNSLRNFVDVKGKKTDYLINRPRTNPGE